MGDNSKIEWTDATWNPVTGCDKVSQGCKFCYAERVAERFWKDRKFTDVRLHDDRLQQPLRWKRPRKIFVNSMSDLFHDDVPFEFIYKVFELMLNAHWHTFQVLTKRAERMYKIMPDVYLHLWRNYPDLHHQALPNVCLGVSCEDQKTADERIPYLLSTVAMVRFISAEPLLGPIDLTRIAKTADGLGWVDAINGTVWSDGINEPISVAHLNWIIVGGESGPHARPMHPNWVRSLRNQATREFKSFYLSTPFFFKQWGEWYPVTRDAKARLLMKDYPHVHLWPDEGEESTVSLRVGKAKAGRIIDDCMWTQFPQIP